MSRPFRPWSLQDELERLYEHLPSNERPPVPPSSSPVPNIAGFPSPVGGTRNAPTAVGPLLLAAAVGAIAPNQDEE